MALKNREKTNFNVDESIKAFSMTEENIKPKKETSFKEIDTATPTENNIKELETIIRNLKIEIKVFEKNKLDELLRQKNKELEEEEKKLKELRENYKGFKGMTSIRIPEEKHILYKNFATENNIKFRQFILLALAYTYKQAKEGKIKITDYGIETIPQL